MEPTITIEDGEGFVIDEMESSNDGYVVSYGGDVYCILRDGSPGWTEAVSLDGWKLTKELKSDEDTLKIYKVPVPKLYHGSSEW